MGATRRRLIRGIVRQFGQPRGPVGRLVGYVMAWRGSNRQRNAWAVSQLDVQPADRVLEIGFGPGIAIRELSHLVDGQGHICGIDHSDVMVRQARRRHAAAIRSGLVELHHGAVERLSNVDGAIHIDKVLAVNSLQFWPDPADRLRELRGRLRPGGTIAIASQPRCPGATAQDSKQAAIEIQALLDEAGFERMRVEQLDLDPPVVCVLATSPGPASA